MQGSGEERKWIKKGHGELYFYSDRRSRRNCGCLKEREKVGEEWEIEWQSKGNLNFGIISKIFAQF